MNDETKALNVYGYTVLFRHPNAKKWTVEPDQDIPVLPSHYDLPEEAADRVEFLRKKGYYARSLALLAERADKHYLYQENKSDE